MRPGRRVGTVATGALWASRLGAVASLAIAATARAAGGEDPAAAAREVFLGPDYGWKRIEGRPASASWLETTLLRPILSGIGRAFARLLDWLGWLLGRLFRVVSGEAREVSIAAWLLIAASLAWAVWKLYRVISARLRSSPPIAPARSATWRALAEASDLFAQAGRSYGAGHYAEAVRLALLALIARLERQGLLRHDPTRTNREYQGDLRPRADLADGFGRLARIYDRIWYGRAEASRADAEEALGLTGPWIEREDLARE